MQFTDLSLTTRKCPTCSLEFRPRAQSQVYCGVRCRAKANRDRERLRDPFYQAKLRALEMLRGEEKKIEPNFGGFKPISADTLAECELRLQTGKAENKPFIFPGGSSLPDGKVGNWVISQHPDNDFAKLATFTGVLVRIS